MLPGGCSRQPRDSGGWRLEMPLRSSIHPRHTACYGPCMPGRSPARQPPRRVVIPAENETSSPRMTNGIGMACCRTFRPFGKPPDPLRRGETGRACLRDMVVADPLERDERGTNGPQSLIQAASGAEVLLPSPGEWFGKAVDLNAVDCAGPARILPFCTARDATRGSGVRLADTR